MRFSTAIAAAVIGFASAHPGEVHEASESALMMKRAMLANSVRSVEACAGKLEASGLNKRAILRRRAAVEKHKRSAAALKKPRGKIDRRSAESVLATSHNHTGEGITQCTDTTTLFASNGTCVLNPVSEFGPFWVKGEYVREDLREDQPGVSVIIDGQFIDAETCEPLSGVWWDMWNCNSTGVYSGVDSTANEGNDNDHANINTTFLRGIQQTDDDGVVQFHTLFPGHYSGRATHTHVIAHLDAELLPNNTISGGEVSFVGHMFWDQDLIYEVESTHPYNTSDIAITLNEDDSIFPNEADITDPVFNYVYLGDDVTDGLFAWITVAINTSAVYTESYSFELTADGGVAVDASDDINGGAGGMPSGSMGSGMPTGAMPTGTAAPSDT